MVGLGPVGRVRRVLANGRACRQKANAEPPLAGVALSHASAAAGVGFEVLLSPLQQVFQRHADREVVLGRQQLGRLEERGGLTQRVDRRKRLADFRERTRQIASRIADRPQPDSVTLLREDRDR